MQTSNCFDLRLIPPNQFRSNIEMATGAGDLILSSHCSNHHNGVKKEVATDHETSIIHTQRTVSGPNEYHQIMNPENILKCENNFEKIDRDHIIR